MSSVEVPPHQDVPGARRWRMAAARRLRRCRACSAARGPRPHWRPPAAVLRLRRGLRARARVAGAAPAVVSGGSGAPGHAAAASGGWGLPVAPSPLRLAAVPLALGGPRSAGLGSPCAASFGCASVCLPLSGPVSGGRPPASGPRRSRWLVVMATAAELLAWVLCHATALRLSPPPPSWRLGGRGPVSPPPPH